MAEPASDKMRNALERLEVLLARQIECVRAEDHAGAGALAGEVEAALREASACAAADDADVLERLRRIRAMHRQLRLTLAAAHDALARKVQHVQRGKRGLRAYGRGRSGP